jgi:hypothetical protein
MLYCILHSSRTAESGWLFAGKQMNKITKKRSGWSDMKEAGHNWNEKGERFLEGGGSMSLDVRIRLTVPRSEEGGMYLEGRKATRKGEGWMFLEGEPSIYLEWEKLRQLGERLSAPEEIRLNVPGKGKRLTVIGREKDSPYLEGSKGSH